MPVKSKQQIDAYLRKTYDELCRGHEEVTRHIGPNDEALIERKEALSALASDFHVAELRSDFEEMAELCDQFDLWPDFQMDGESREYFLRAMMRVSVISIKHLLRIIDGDYTPAPAIDHILVDIQSADTPARHFRVSGRPAGTDWEALRSKLLEMESKGQFAETPHGWRTKVGRELAAWALEQFGDDLQANTIRNHPIIKPELDRIKKGNS